MAGIKTKWKEKKRKVSENQYKKGKKKLCRNAENEIFTKDHIAGS